MELAALLGALGPPEARARIFEHAKSFARAAANAGPQPDGRASDAQLPSAYGGKASMGSQSRGDGQQAQRLVRALSRLEGCLKATDGLPPHVALVRLRAAAAATDAAAADAGEDTVFTVDGGASGRDASPLPAIVAAAGAGLLLPAAGPGHPTPRSPRYAAAAPAIDLPAAVAAKEAAAVDSTQPRLEPADACEPGAASASGAAPPAPAAHGGPVSAGVAALPPPAAMPLGAPTDCRPLDADARAAAAGLPTPSPEQLQLSAGVADWHAGVVAELRRRREEAARKRIELLKSRDMQAYLALQPAGLTARLREYQMHGLRWLVGLHDARLNGILADDMGLGKTLQVIALCVYMNEVRGIRDPFLIAAPSSVLPNWAAELARWAPGLRVVDYRGSADTREDIWRTQVCAAGGGGGKRRGGSGSGSQQPHHQPFQVLLTSYDFLMGKYDRPRLARIKYSHIIVDEGHRLKNAGCKLNAELQHYRADSRLLLTGTPLQNRLDELWALLNFLMPGLFGSGEDFAACDGDAEHLQPPLPQVLLFSTMTRALDVIEEYLDWRGFEFARLDGGTAAAERGQLIADFNSPDSPTFIFLLSLKAGGVGLNLQAGTAWVVVFRLLTAASIEGHIAAVAEDKRKLTDSSITGVRRALPPPRRCSVRPYYPDARSAAAAADYYNYKLRGAAAHLNLGLTPEQRLVLDTLSLEQLQAYIKGRGDVWDLGKALEPAQRLVLDTLSLEQLQAHIKGRGDVWDLGKALEPAAPVTVTASEEGPDSTAASGPDGTAAGGEEEAVRAEAPGTLRCDAEVLAVAEARADTGTGTKPQPEVDAAEAGAVPQHAAGAEVALWGKEEVALWGKDEVWRLGSITQYDPSRRVAKWFLSYNEGPAVEGAAGASAFGGNGDQGPGKALAIGKVAPPAEPPAALLAAPLEGAPQRRPALPLVLRSGGDRAASGTGLVDAATAEAEVEAQEGGPLAGGAAGVEGGALPASGGGSGFKYITAGRAGSGTYKAQITLKGTVFYSPFYPDARSAAAAADYYNYKLRGAAAHLNLGLTPEQRLVLDTLSLEQLQAYIKGRGDVWDLGKALEPAVSWGREGTFRGTIVCFEPSRARLRWLMRYEDGDQEWGAFTPGRSAWRIHGGQRPVTGFASSGAAAGGGAEAEAAGAGLGIADRKRVAASGGSSAQPAGRGGRKRAYRYIETRNGNTWRAHVMNKTAHLQSPYYPDARSAAAAADYYNYKLRGAAAHLNLCLTPEQRLVLDTLSLEQLQAYIKGRGDVHDLAKALTGPVVATAEDGA
eukprot:XP_001703553.1 SWI2/SNF2-like protein [Chlamydomonas reinhardtii]